MKKTDYKNELSSFEFYKDYVSKEKALQPEYYSEVQRILDKNLTNFKKEHKRKPVIIDIGSAGITPYSTDLVDMVIIIELFEQPNNLRLPKNISWHIANILDENTVEYLAKKYQADFIIASSLLHHLCDSENNAITNLTRFFKNIAIFDNADIFIFESICPHILAKLQDFLFPIQSFILKKIIGFANVRMLSMKEISRAIASNNLEYETIKFKQPKYIAQFFIKVPLFLYPLKIVSLKISKKTRKTLKA